MNAHRALLRWYEPRRRAFPWRRSSDPYRVLVSEVMLQQTQVPRVVSAYRRFLRRFPSVRALARAEDGDVLRAWAGLGYNRRAVALAQAARSVVRDHGGRFPQEPRSLRQLPGVGPYTAAAVASMSFGVPVAAVDTNVRRVVARAVLGSEPADADPDELARAADAWVDRTDPGSWNQAVMDLGREVCRPRPRCQACPLRPGCRFRPRGVSPAPPTRRQSPFDGSSRQLRGAVVRSLLPSGSRSVASIRTETGRPARDVVRAIRALASEGLVRAGPGALAGKPSGRVRLP
ncbi:MAG TPA: A/G-specific adenine glycosylase [Actinomycetota bacterium]|nr:A/G-specific adenine glycosylase [Actinomycetota bacterium]